MGTTSMRRSIAWATACLMASADSGWAHPGHGTTDPQGPAHYVLEPLHSLPILLVAMAIAGVWAASRLRRRIAARRECRNHN